MLLRVDPIGAFVPTAMCLVLLAIVAVEYRLGWPPDTERRVGARSMLRFLALLTVAWIIIGTVAVLRG